MAGYAPQNRLDPLVGDPLKEWLKRVELSRARRNDDKDTWEKLRRAYMPGDGGDLNSNIHFRNVHLKTAELWAQMPELHLKALEPMLDLGIPPEDVISVKRSLLNKLLGPDHADVDMTVEQALFDVFMTSGIGPTKICYESDQPEIETDVPIPGQFQPTPGTVLGLAEQIPVTEKQMVPGPPVAERWRWYRFSPLKLLRPHDWNSTIWDEAPWLGMEFVEPLTARNLKRYNLPDDFQSNITSDELVMGKDESHKFNGSVKLIKGVEIWLKASIYDDSVINSQCYRRLVLIDGYNDQSAVYEESPYQKRNPDQTLTKDSMLGNPIHPLTLRVLSDSDSPPADAAFTNPLVMLENTWATQDVKLRDANIPRFIYPDSITEALNKLKNADAGMGAGVADDILRALGKEVIIPIPHLERAESDVQGRQSNRRLIDETLGLGANQAGGLNSTVRSATEVATVQANVSVRLKGEQNQLMKWWLSGVRKFDALVMMFMTDPGYIEIVGQNGDKRLQVFNQAMLSGKYAYDATPDSQLTMDPERRKKNFLDFTNFFAKSPWMDQGELARLGANEFGYDPARLVKQPQPPAAEKPNVSYRFSGDDLANPIAVAIMNKRDGGPITVQDIQQAQQLIQATAQMVMTQPAPMQMDAMAAEAAKNQPHGGAADKADQLSEHQGEQTGEMDGRAPRGVPQGASLH